MYEPRWGRWPPRDITREIIREVSRRAAEPSGEKVFFGCLWEIAKFAAFVWLVWWIVSVDARITTLERSRAMPSPTGQTVEPKH
jgi:hypothetical protein